MHAIVVYESMFGNTRHVAEAVARGLDHSGKVRATPVSAVIGIDPRDFELLVVGGPTHRHGMSRESSRRAADNVAAASSNDLTMEVVPTDEGVREWLDSLSGISGRAASFDTRRDDAPLLTGRASKGLAKLLRAAGYEMIAEPESFLVDSDSHLLPGEVERAQAWGETLAGRARG